MYMYCHSCCIQELWFSNNRTLHQNIEKERYHQKELSGLKQCGVCEVQFGIIFNSGAKCPVCGHKVCKRCRQRPLKPPPKFVCTVCYEMG